MTPMETRDSTVLIVGAGPVGLTVALVLSHFDVPFRIIDKSHESSDISKALVIWRRSLQCLNPFLSMDRIRKGHQTANGVRLYSKGRNVAFVSFEDAGRGDPPAVMIPQYDTERLLLEMLDNRGIEVDRGVELVEFSQDREGVRAILDQNGSRSEHGHAWMIGCDGGHSSVRKQLDVPFPGETDNRRWLLADVEIEQASASGEILIETSPEGLVACFPIAENRWRVFCDAGSVDQGLESEPVTLDRIQAILDDRTSWGWRLLQAFWLSAYHINERQVDEYRHGRIFLAGDAAHVHSPAGGQGMNTGIQDAINLAWKLAMVHHGQAPETLLETYHAERHPIGAMVVKGSALLMKNASHTGVIARGIRSVLVPLASSITPIRRKLIGMLTEDHVNYREGPLAGIRHGDLVHSSGDGFPDRLIKVDGKICSSTCLLSNPGPTIILLGEGIDVSGVSFGYESASMPITIRRVAPGESAEDESGLLARSLGLHDGGAVLVRPDGVIAAVGTTVQPLQAWCHDRLLANRMPY